jgi:hypothetical protein
MCSAQLGVRRMSFERFAHAASACALSQSKKTASDERDLTARRCPRSCAVGRVSRRLSFSTANGGAKVPRKFFFPKA